MIVYVCVDSRRPDSPNSLRLWRTEERASNIGVKQHKQFYVGPVDVPVYDISQAGTYLRKNPHLWQLDDEDRLN